MWIPKLLKKWCGVFSIGRKELSDVNTNNGKERMHQTVKAELGVTDDHQLAGWGSTAKGIYIVVMNTKNLRSSFIYPLVSFEMQL